MERLFVLFLLLAFVIFTGYFSLMQAVISAQITTAKGRGSGQERRQKREKAKQAENEKEAGRERGTNQSRAGRRREKLRRPRKQKPGEKTRNRKKPLKTPPEEPRPRRRMDLSRLGRSKRSISHVGYAYQPRRGLGAYRTDSSRYRNIDDRSGYLGRLVMDKTSRAQGGKCKWWARHSGRKGRNQGRRRDSGNQRQTGHFLLFTGKRKQSGRKTRPGQSAEDKKNILERTRPGQTVKIKSFATARN